VSGPGVAAARLVGCTMLADLALSQELAAAVEQVELYVAELEGALGRFAGLEVRLEHAADLTDHDPSDEELAWIWELFGTATVRPVLERLDQAHPDHPRS
jgi:hypothetical protein